MKRVGLNDILRHFIANKLKMLLVGSWLFLSEALIMKIKKKKKKKKKKNQIVFM